MDKEGVELTNLFSFCCSGEDLRVCRGDMRYDLSTVGGVEVGRWLAQYTCETIHFGNRHL